MLTTTMQPGPVLQGCEALYDFVEYADAQVLRDVWKGRDAQLGSTTGVDTNDPAWTGEGLDFDGTDDYVVLPIEPIAPTLIGSVFVAANRTTTSHPSRVYGEGNSGDDLPLIFIGANDVASDNRVRLAVRNDANNFTDVLSTSFPYNSWSITGARLDGSTANIIVNGGTEGSLALPSLPISIDRVRIGALARVSTVAFWGGPIGMSAHYSRALSDTEIAQNYRDTQRRIARRGVSI